MILWDFGTDLTMWGWSRAKGWVGDEASGILVDTLTMITMWVLDAAASTLLLVLGTTRLGQVTDSGAGAMGVDYATQPFLDSTWFGQAFGAMQSIGLWTAALAMIVGITTAAWSLNGALLLRRLSLQLLKWYFLTFFLVTMTSTAMQIFDGMEQFFVQSTMGESSGELFGGLVGVRDTASESGALSSLLVVLVSMLLVVLSLAVVLILFVRDAALALVLLFAPLVSGLLMTSHGRSVGAYLNKVASLVVLKFVLIASMTLGAAAMVSVAGIGTTQFGTTQFGALAGPPADPPLVLTVDEAEAQRVTTLAGEQASVASLIRDMLAGSAVLGLSLFTPGFVSSILPMAGGDSHADKGQLVMRSAGSSANRRLPKRRR